MTLNSVRFFSFFLLSFYLLYIDITAAFNTVYVFPILTRELI